MTLSMAAHERSVWLIDNGVSIYSDVSLYLTFSEELEARRGMFNDDKLLKSYGGWDVSEVFALLKED